MLDWISVSFLCLFVISGSDSLEGRDFMNLSQFDYHVNELFDIFSITFANIPDVKMRIKCSNCISIESLRINCTQNELVKVDIEMEYKYIRISFSFNISCTTWINGQRIPTISNIDSRPGTNDISISWNPPSSDINNYLVIVMDSYLVYSKEILRETSYRVMHLNETSWYQICIASIDRMWRTSKFECTKVLTDFSTTGPVTNVTKTSENNSLSISWSPPVYKYDTPQGIIIYLQGRTNQMCRLYIIKQQLDIDPASKYSCVTTETIISSLSSLEIKDLPPNSEFSIEISPFNRNKKSAIKHLSIKTKEGESGPVQNLKVDPDRDPHNIHISFDAPINPAGIILKYRLRVILKRINICTSSDDIIHEAYTDNLYGNISKSVMKKCGSYVLDVAPYNGWNINGGEGKTATVPFNYSVDHQSSWTVNTKFISSNSLTVSLWGLKEDKCENFGFIIEIKDEKDHSNCLTRIISSLDCETFEREINTTQKCQMKQYITKYNPSSTYESFFSGIFPSGNSYEVNLYKIENHITKVTQKSTEIAKAGECFTDCYSYPRFYPGIRSATQHGKVCTNWKNSKYKNKSAKSNICTYVDGARPWCPDTNSDGWEYCDAPSCFSINFGTGCAGLINKQENVQSVTIRWFQPQSLVPIIGYLVLLHNSDHFCEQAIIELQNSYGKSDALESQIKSLYLSCKSKEDKSSITYQATFNNLHQNRNYNVYIAPIMSSSSVGEIRNVTVRTVLAKPHIPNGVNYQLVTLHTITVFWGKNNETQTNGPAESYVAHITNRNTRIRVSNVINTESVIFGDLEMCTEYCFVLSSYNNAGYSGYTKEICTMTLAPKPQKSQLADPPSGYMTSQSLSWTYLGSDNCQKRYLVEFGVKFLPGKSNYSISNDTSIVLTGLTPNVNYTVRVRAEGQMKTVNNESIGELSDYKEYYTGKLQLNLSYYQHNIDNTNKILNISWGIEDEMRGSIFMYIIRVKNSFKFCMYSVLLACQTCREPWCWNNVKNQYGESLKKLTNCTVSLNRTMDADQTSFNYRLSYKKEFTNFSVDVYGVNLMGIHLLHGESTITPPLPGSSLPIIIGLTVFIVILLILAILIFLKYKRNPKKTERKIEESYLMNRTKNLKRSSANNSENNGDLVQNKPKKRLSDLDQMPTLNSRKSNNKISISTFPAYYGEVSKNGSAELIKQYKKLTNEAKAQETELDLTVFIGKEAENSKKNRFINILPFDQTRVKVGNKGPPMDYINANYIPFENDEKEVEYIAAQGPIDGSLSDFWQMIWEQNIDCIVMLTRTEEDDKFKCLQYWPNDEEEIVRYGNQNQFNVSLMNEDTKEAFIERELNVQNSKNNESRKIIQLHMHTWSDHSAPNLNYFDNLLFRFHEITNQNASNPYLIHCSAGVGRTGTMICIDRIIKELIGGSQEIKIYDTVLKLRKYRNFMVQRQAQYIFIHDYIKHFLEKYIKTEGTEDNVYFNDAEPI